MVEWTLKIYGGSNTSLLLSRLPAWLLYDCKVLSKTMQNGSQNRENVSSGGYKMGALGHLGPDYGAMGAQVDFRVRFQIIFKCLRGAAASLFDDFFWFFEA